MGVSNENAPFKKSPQFNRDSFLRTPDWRWQQARRIVYAQQRQQTCINEMQPLILYAVRLQKAFRNVNTREFLKTKLADAWHVITLATGDQSSQLRAQLQACFIYGLSPQQIVDKLKWINLVQVKLYQDLFFDLSGIKGISAWFEQMLLQPARLGKSMNLFRARALAHYHSLQAALHSLRFGNPGKSAKEAMNTMWRNVRNTQVFDYIAKQLKIPVQVYVQSMQQAIKGRQDRDFILESKQGQTTNVAIGEISKALQNSIRGFTQSQINNTSDAAKFGVDFTNNYIEHIKNNQEEKNEQSN